MIDLGGDVRRNPKLSGTTHNVFGIQTGVAVSFLVRKEGSGIRKGKVFFHSRPEFEKASEKLAYLHENDISQVPFVHLNPDRNGTWLNVTNNDWADQVPVCLPKLSGAKTSTDQDSIFALATFGNVSARDSWVYDQADVNLESKMKFYFGTYEAARKSLPRPFEKGWDTRLGGEIKWSQDVRANLERDQKLVFDPDIIVSSMYRPYVKRLFYYSKWANWSLYKLPEAFPIESEWANSGICFSGLSSGSQFSTLAVNSPFSFDFLGRTQCIPLFRRGKNGERVDNVTDWALKLFQGEYGVKLTKLDIFHYVYGVLHHPAYRTKYEVNLKRDLPRVPLYPDFNRWRNAGCALMDLHIGFETAELWPLTVTDGRKPAETGLFESLTDKKSRTVIRLDKEANRLEFVTPTGPVVIEGFSPSTWSYKLGHRSAVEWVLDQYADYTPKDPTVAEKFHTYKLADHLDEVIALIGKVTRVSVATVEIVEGLSE